MAFELMEKRAGLQVKNPVEVSVSKSGFSIGSDLTKNWGENACAEILLDRVDNKIGFRPSNSLVTGFKFNKQGKSWTLSAGAASKLIPKGAYIARLEGNMIVFDVKEIADARK